MNKSRNFDFCVLLFVFTSLQALFLIWLFSQQRADVIRRIMIPDTLQYVYVTKCILSGSGLPQDIFRTIGYPLFLLGPFFLGSENYGYHITIVMQCIINLLCAFLFWSLIEALFPKIRTSVKIITVSILWISLFGLALRVMSDFLFCFLFLLFLYIFLLKKGILWLIIGSCALCLAQLTRPILIPFLLILPLLKLFAQSKAYFSSLIYLVIFAFFIVMGHAVNSAIESTRINNHSDTYFAYAVRCAIAQTDPSPPGDIYLRIEKKANKTYNKLTRNERNYFFRDEFIDYILTNPIRFVMGISKNAVKDLISPIEGVFSILIIADNNNKIIANHFYYTHFRLILRLIWLTICFFAFWPGMVRLEKTRHLYFTTMVILLFFMSLGSFFGGQGERYRSPAMPMILVCFAYNLDSIVSCTTSRRKLLL